MVSEAHDGMAENRPRRSALRRRHRERSVIRLADELYDSAGVSDCAYAGLEAHFTPPQILELVIIGGWYHTISFVINAARMQLEPWATRFPSDR
jgi:4-carboxymuconolactone decarboxylase